MILNNESTEPIYIQIARWLEDEILAGRILADEKIYSQYQLAEIFHINPATAAKGISLLLDRGLLYQKRGLGTFLEAHASEQIRVERVQGSLNQMLEDLITEAGQLGISQDKLLAMMRDKLGVMRDGVSIEARAGESKTSKKSEDIMDNKESKQLEDVNKDKLKSEKRGG